MRASILEYVLLFSITFIATGLHGQSGLFIRAADGSVLDQVEQSGGSFYDDGAEMDAYAIFKKYGFTHIRLKLWHTPELPYNSLPNVLQMASRAKEMGMGIILDFHYSDTWADPGRQNKPAAWEGISFEALSDSMYAYTRYVIEAMDAQNTLPEMVQIGNEITCGMLWNDGRVCDDLDTPQQWNKLATLINSGISGMNDALTGKAESPRVIIHFDNGGSNGGCRWFFDNLQQQDVSFDIIGLSFYPWWHGTLANLEFNLNDLAARYGKDIIVVEIAYPWTLGWNDNTNNIVGNQNQLHEGYPATVEGQFNYLSDLISIVKNTNAGKGIGVAYWSPEWISAPEWGSPWENVALFGFDNEVLESIRAFEDNADVAVSEALPGVKATCYPNPFQSEANLQLTLPSPALVQLSVFDVNGSSVSIRKEQELRSGSHSINWDATELPGGLYILVFTIDGKKLTLQVVKTE